MAGPFPENSHPTGEEYETFTSRLEPIVEQMESIELVPSHRSSIIYLLFTGPSRKICEGLEFLSLALVEIIDEVKMKVLLNEETKDRQITTCASCRSKTFAKAPTLERRPLESA